MEVFAILSLILLVLMLIIINGHVTVTPTYPVASPFLEKRQNPPVCSQKSRQILTKSDGLVGAILIKEDMGNI